MEAATTLPVTSQYYVPRGRLAEFVDIFWYWRGHDVPYSKERVLPDGSIELVIRLERHRPSDSGISGARSQSIVIERTTHDELLGVHFKPGGAFPFVGFPSGELHNRGIRLDDLWGERRASQLLSRLHDTPTVETKFRVLENWLLGIAERPLNHHPAVSFAMREFQNDPGLRSSAEVAERTGFSQRCFIKLFRDEIGMTPKLFCRVQRFHQVLRRIHSKQAVDWVDVALSCGYFDQSHFIHDFRMFSSLSPTEYLQLRTADSPLHVEVRG